VDKPPVFLLVPLVSDNGSLELMDTFCYLGDMLSVQCFFLPMCYDTVNPCCILFYKQDFEIGSVFVSKAVDGIQKKFVNLFDGLWGTLGHILGMVN